MKVPEPRFDFFTAAEGNALVQAARDAEERALPQFALHTGARADEQLGVQWGDIDWRSKSIRFRRALLRGKVGPTKSGRERTVPLTGALEKALQEIRHLRGPLVLCNPDGSPLTIWRLTALIELTGATVRLSSPRNQRRSLGVPLRTRYSARTSSSSKPKSSYLRSRQTSQLLDTIETFADIEYRASVALAVSYLDGDRNDCRIRADRCKAKDALRRLDGR